MLFLRESDDLRSFDVDAVSEAISRSGCHAGNRIRREKNSYGIGPTTSDAGKGYDLTHVYYCNS